MKLKLKDGTILKVTLTREIWKFPQTGLYQSSAKILHKEAYYICYPRFEDGNIIINRIHKEVIGSKTGQTQDAIDDFELIQPISNSKKNIILFMLNRHRLNRRIYAVKDTLYKRRKTIISFAVPVVGGLTYYLINYYSENALMKLIGSNLLLQSVLFGMTIIGIMKLWRPFAVKQGFTEKDAEELYHKLRQDEIDNERLEKNASF